MGRTSKKKPKKKNKKDKKDQEVAGIFDWAAKGVNWADTIMRRLKGDKGDFTYSAKGGPIRKNKGGPVDARKIAKKYFKGVY